MPDRDRVRARGNLRMVGGIRIPTQGMLAVRRTAAFTLAFALAACASGSASSGSNLRRNANQITIEELEQPAVMRLTLMDAIHEASPELAPLERGEQLLGLGESAPGADGERVAPALRRPAGTTAP